jgi:hypothetical protein
VIDAAVVRHGRSSPDACSVVWDKAQTSALGTAPSAMFWVALEQNGPWGAQAATQSHLDPDLGRTLNRMCQDATGRFVLIRRPGAHSDLPEGNPHRVDLPEGNRHRVDLSEGNPHRVYVAGGLAGRPWLLEADLDDPARLARLVRLGIDALRHCDIDAVQVAMPELRRSPAPVLMICSNSRRDICCSVRGRPVALESALQRPGQVWECSHTGGHRFAPTGVLLPYGQTLGRLSGASAVAAVDAALRGELPTALMGATYDRGRSHLSAPGQAAESVVRQQIQEPGLLAFATTVEPRPDQENAWNCRVSHVDGRHWEVVAERAPGGDDLPESCGKAPAPTWQWSVLSDFGR